MKVACALLLAAFTVPAWSADTDQKVRELMEAQGLMTTFEQQIQQGKAIGKQTADQMLSQILASLNPPAEFKLKLRAAADSFIDELQSPFTAQAIVDKWAKLYGSRFSDEELDQLLKFYKSPLAQREVSVSREAMAQLATGLQSEYRPIQQAATEAFVTRVKAIAEECNCRK